MSLPKVVIVIPVYKTDLKWYEKIAINRALEVLGKYHIVFCCPESLDIGLLNEKYGVECAERFDDSYFRSIETYNRLMMSVEFYERFFDFEYMLIYQLDAFVFSDMLERFCKLNFSYIGAPWPHCRWNVYTIRKKKYRFNVGNGGFSLRKIADFVNILKKHQDEVSEWTANEDVFFAYVGRVYQNEFKVAPFRVAMQFAFEFSAKRLYRKNNRQLPFGCHAWIKFGKDIYLDLFRSVNVDIDEYKDLLKSEDIYYEQLVVRRRFNSQIKNGSSFFEIMTVEKNWSVVGLGKLGRQLIKAFLDNGGEITSIYDSRFSDCQKDWEGIRCCNLNDTNQLIKEKGRIIIITINYEQELIEKLESMGLVYGDDFISLCRGYAERFKCFGYKKYLYSSN